MQTRLWALHEPAIKTDITNLSQLVANKLHNQFFFSATNKMKLSFNIYIYYAKNMKARINNGN